MKTFSLLFLSFLLMIAGMFVACEEVDQAGEYDNWQARNEAFIDSIRVETGSDNVVATLSQADEMELGKLYAIQVPTNSTMTTPQYVYCKKLVANKEGERPVYTGYHSSVSAFYYGTLITGIQFDGNFIGFGATDRVIEVPLPDAETDGSIWPTEFDSPTTFAVSGVIAGWIWPLQYMRAGERWLLYIPWQSAYGSSGTSTGTIRGYSALTFDIMLEEVL